MLLHYSKPLAILYFAALAFSAATIANARHPKPELQHAKQYQQQVISIEDYWVSEKLDGIRGYWTGTQLLTRQGNVINVPDWFTKNWPNTALDGEIWMARNQFEQTLSCVAKKAPSNCWKRIKFMVFDLPKSNLPFEQRIEKITHIIQLSSNAYLSMVTQQKLANLNELNALLASITAQGGEGLMLHLANSYYTKGRTKNLLKVKQRFDDEAIVIEHIPGRGKYQGMLGALRVKNSENIIFKIGSGFSDQERNNPPLIGTTITYQYFGKTANNVPKFASFLRVRKGL